MAAGVTLAPQDQITKDRDVVVKWYEGFASITTGPGFDQGFAFW